MARVALEIPKVGLVMENARLVRWLKHVGDTVREGEPVLELETEKSLVEIESAENGRLVEILLQVDQEAHVGDRVAWLENDAEEPAHPTEAAKSSAASLTPAPMSMPAAAAARGSPQPHSDPGTRPSGRIRSSPVARRLASQHAVNLAQVSGTGPRGRIQLADVRRAIDAKYSTGTSSGTVAGAGFQPLSGMRRALARSMTLSNATVPQFIVERAVDWSTVESIRADLSARLAADLPRPSVNDFLLQALARALLSFPAMNATFSGDVESPDAGLVSADGAHIGLVVAVPNGLLVPVFHGVEQLSLVELARQRSAAIRRALNGKLKREELDGATLSLSNLGTRGPDRFTAIINPPQSAILAVGRRRDCVVAVNGAPQVRPMSQLALTLDHRVADGRLASDFLAAVVATLEGHDWRCEPNERSP